jgi:hypothetical protein
MKTFQEILKEFEEVITEKYMPFRQLCVQGLSRDEILRYFIEDSIISHEDIIQLYQWSNGTAYSGRDSALFDAYYLMPLKFALSEWSDVRETLNEFSLDENQMPIFDDDFGEKCVVNMETGVVSYMYSANHYFGDDGNLRVMYKSLPEMIETITQRYRDEEYIFVLDETTGKTEIQFN